MNPDVNIEVIGDKWPALLERAVAAALVAGDHINEIYARDFTVSYKADESPLTAADRAAHDVIAAALAPSGLPLLSEEGAAISFSERRHWQTLWLVDPLDGTKEFVKRNGEFTVNIALVHNGAPLLGVVYAPVPRNLFIGVAGVGAYAVRGVDARDAVLAACAAGCRGLPLQPLTAAPLAADDPLRVVASRSHGSPETDAFIAALARYGRGIERVSSGSSLKLCMVAAGEAHVYPRLAPTMEWDTAAAQAVVNAAGGTVVVCDNVTLQAVCRDGVGALFAAPPLTYNRAELLNPWFVVLHPSMKTL